MTNERWNELQSEVFKNTFTMNIDGISLKDTIVNLSDRINIWKNVYKLLGDVLDPIDKTFNVRTNNNRKRDAPHIISCK